MRHQSESTVCHCWAPSGTFPNGHVDCSPDELQDLLPIPELDLDAIKASLLEVPIVVSKEILEQYSKNDPFALPEDKEAESWDLMLKNTKAVDGGWNDTKHLPSLADFIRWKTSFLIPNSVLCLRWRRRRLLLMIYSVSIEDALYSYFRSLDFIKMYGYLINTLVFRW